MNRRQFFFLGAAALGTVGAKWRWQERLPDITVDRVGMKQGHQVREPWRAADFPLKERLPVVILGSGIAGLTCAWQLDKAGFHDFVVITGPERYGNAAFGDAGEGMLYPKGAHYLPFPSLSSVHVRELLAEMGISQKDVYGKAPYYDERAILHSPDERIFDPQSASWQEGLFLNADEAKKQFQRFFLLVDSLKNQLGQDGKRLFDMPIAQLSSDTRWHHLDKLTFQEWLVSQQFTHPHLLDYLDYACRDDYGAGLKHVSAWAGIHYFAGRDGHAANAADGGLLTWPEGLGKPASWMAAKLAPHQLRDGMAMKVELKGENVAVYIQTPTEKYRIESDRVVMAMPLHVTKHLLPLNAFGFDDKQHMPVHSPWLVTNFILDDFPEEKPGETLAWDNIVSGSEGLGYVVATHQWIRQYRPEKTVFTAYRTLPFDDAKKAREWLAEATEDELFASAMVDLELVYDKHQLYRRLARAEISVRAHAMATPTPGFLSNEGLKQLRAQSGRVLFAHSDLSGYSVFEEAAWWGYRAADKILGRVS
ncbi:FAD-dependent oxidoreductase [Leeia sp. TBRC 13508]|uniref:FAD-dependent oxidoreductase n=1 Tax=Leeia speluncae TaxID=2884804 RepID=A0ABS8D5A7_9NEIS|nr:FAD-dependent oxidoreductase [Leeia speluncae]MCB6183178.1 FAD-dependent oxidoreductase [Leeia speluncae]